MAAGRTQEFSARRHHAGAASGGARRLLPGDFAAAPSQRCEVPRRIVGTCRGDAGTMPVPGCSSPARVHRPHDPCATALYALVVEQRATFASVAREAGGVPSFVDESFERFLRCGVLAHGFARFGCASCGHDHLVPLSCKTRGLCPSCGGRRMAALTRHIMDFELPARSRSPVGAESALPSALSTRLRPVALHGGPSCSGACAAPAAQTARARARTPRRSRPARSPSCSATAAA